MNTSSEKTCCFTGHRPDKLPWKHNENDPDCLALKKLINELLDALYADDFRHFLCGMAAGTDMYCGEAVIDLKKAHPDVTLEAVIPCRGQERKWPRALRDRYCRLEDACDSVTVLHDTYRAGCMMERNRYMVDRSSLVVAVYDGKRGGTKNTREYAFSQGRRIIELPTAGLTP